jgi:hypothetical protein
MISVNWIDSEEKQQEIDEATENLEALFEELIEKADELGEAAERYAELTGNDKPLKAYHEFGIPHALKP